MTDLAKGALAALLQQALDGLAEANQPTGPTVIEQCQYNTNRMPILSSDRNTIYMVTLGNLTEGGSTCTCLGNHRHGYCRHTIKAEKARCGWNALILNEPQVKFATCPRCASPTERITLP